MMTIPKILTTLFSDNNIKNAGDFMKLLIVGINAKYVHTNLAVRYLDKCVSGMCDTVVCEYSINDNKLSTERDILLQKPDIVAFACYIWNIGLVKEIASDVKSAYPHIKIVLGGPEVSFDGAKLLSECTYVDCVVCGEGEVAFPGVINHYVNGGKMPKAGVVYRKDGEITENGAGEVLPLDDIPFPYDDSISELGSRIVYYESSRGCPYSCKYCLSGEKGNVRFKSLENVKKDLTFFDSHGVPLVKFVDRTFNADRKRAREIWSHIFSLKGNTRFHMEITGELLDEETVSLLKTGDADKLQFEIGVQTTNTKTLEAIDRVCNTEKLFENIKLLLSETHIHIHLDLIVGLPYEDFETFKHSFNDVVSLKPHVLQIGFLKVLKGSAMRGEAETHGIIYRNEAPYEIISNKYLTCEEVWYLKDLDFVFDKYYNSGSFGETLEYLYSKFDTPFDVFAKIIDFYREYNLINSSLSKPALYDKLYDCFKDFGDDFEEVLRYDYIKALSPGKLPGWCNSNEDFKLSEEVYDFLKDEEAKKMYMPCYFGTPAKMIIKHFRFERFKEKTLAFDYKRGEVYDVTGYFE